MSNDGLNIFKLTELLESVARKPSFSHRFDRSALQQRAIVSAVHFVTQPAEILPVIGAASDRADI